MANSPVPVPASYRADRVDEDDLLRIIDEEVRNGITFANDDKADARSDALDYYDGIMRDLPAERGRSSVVSRDVADVIDAVLPGLMRMFAGASTLGVYEPAKPGDEQAAAQATDYVNHVLANDCDGYRTLGAWIMDGLQVRNGVVKVYWDTREEHEVETLRSLSGEQITMMQLDGDLKPEDVLGVQGRVETIPNPMGGPAIPLEVFDLRVRRLKSPGGRLRIDNVPPEDFGISSRARTIEDAPCVWQIARLTRSDLVKQGFDPAVVEGLPAHDRAPTQADADRNSDRDERGAQRGDGAMAEVEVTEAYLYADLDGDGAAESLKVVTAGAAGSRKIIEVEEWPDDRPFVDLTPQFVPHRWMGKSLADAVMDLQRVKTALWRGGLDNTYAQNRPQRVVQEDAIVNPDELREMAFGGLIRIKKGFDPRAAIADLTVPNIAAVSLQAIQAVDALISRRTGISQATAALDPTALDPQTATAEAIKQDAAHARVELIARNMAELGIKKLFAKMLRIIVRNQDRPRTIRLRDKWVDFDPRVWNAGMDVHINVGLGTGSRERDLRMLSAVYARQVEVYRELGANNPVVTPRMMMATLHKMVEASGLKNPESYFADISDEAFAQWMASKPPAEPDPKVAAIEARAQAEMQRMQAQVSLGREKAAADVQLDQQRMTAEMQMERERIQQEYALKVEELNRKFALRQTEMAQEADLRAAAMVTGSAVSPNLPRQ